MTALFEGDGIKQLIPQREPIIMVDSFLESSAEGCLAGFTLREDCIFCSNGSLMAEGVIEHMAQSASAWIGHRGEGARIGYIGEVRDFVQESKLNVGQSLLTRIELISEALGVVLVRAHSRCGDRTVASCRMKITT